VRSMTHTKAHDCHVGLEARWVKVLDSIRPRPSVAVGLVGPAPDSLLLLSYGIHCWSTGSLPGRANIILRVQNSAAGGVLTGLCRW